MSSIKRNPTRYVSIKEDGRNELEPDQRLENLVSKPIQSHGSPLDKNEVIDHYLFAIAKEGNVDAFIHELHEHSTNSEQHSSIILHHTTPSGNSLLHAAASSGSTDIVYLLVQGFPSLITSANFQGDTALHASARAGNNDATIALVAYARDHPDDDLLKKKNKKGNTALHDAVMKKNCEVATTLIEADPLVAYIQNGEVKSPLYLAAENNQKDMVHLILEAVAGDEYPTSKLQGKSPANAALENKNLDILKDMANIKPALIRFKDEKDDIPLHFASKMGFYEGVELLLEKYKEGAFERNKKGHYPVHAACRKAHVNVVNRLLREWPDPMELLTRNGQSVIHVSAEKGQENTVDELLKNPQVETIVNEKDEDGNTALHLAAKNGRSMALFALVKNNKVDKEIVNNDDMAPYQIVEQQIKKLEDDDKDRRVDINESKNKEMKMKKQLAQPNYFEVMMASAILHFHGNRRRRIQDLLKLQTEPLFEQELKSRIDNILVVAILVASVTFAGAIQIPRGSDDDVDLFSRQNGVVANNGSLLKAYIYLDVIAMNGAIMASLILCWAKISNQLVWLASILIGFSIYFMCLAFVLAAAIAMSKNVVTFSVLLFVSSLLFLIQTVLCVPLLIPPNGSKFVEKLLSPYIYYGIFRVNDLFHKLVSPCMYHGIFKVKYVFQKLLAKLPHHHNV